MQAGLINWLRLGALGLIWGSSFMVVTLALDGYGPVTVAAGRILVGAVALLILLRFLDIPLPSLTQPLGRKIWLAALGFGACSMALPFFLLSWGQQYVASGFAGVSMASVPLILLPMAHFLIPGEQLSIRKTLGFSVGFIGVVVLIGLDAFKSSGLGMEPWARLACFGAAACYATGGIITKRAPSTNPISFAATATLLAAMIIVPIALIQEGVPDIKADTAFWATLYLGVVPTAVANLLLVAVIHSAGPSFLSLVNYQLPVWSVLFGTLFLHEQLPTRLFIALALILLGLAIVQSRKRVKSPPQPQ
ncbi:MAG: EamA family transporter [Rhodobacterales bacterium]|nr:MAG: EamA family transporter [Rhodobacterales bacterium]